MWRNVQLIICQKSQLTSWLRRSWTSGLLATSVTFIWPSASDTLRQGYNRTEQNETQLKRIPSVTLQNILVKKQTCGVYCRHVSNALIQGELGLLFLVSRFIRRPVGQVTCSLSESVV